MALQGTLKDFSITEIIQLIGQQLKTGVSKIRRGKSLVEISFVDGMIVHVYSNYRGQKDLIGEILVKAQLITEEQLERVLKIQRDTLKYLGEILVELQLLTKDDVLKVISTQIYETIYDLFWWEDGHFNFDLKLVESYKKIPFALSTEQVLLNILRMVDEWSEIEKKIFSPHLVFRKPLGAEEKSAGVLSPQSLIREALTFVYYGAFLILIFLLLIYFKPNFLRLFWDSKIERVNIEAPALFVHRAQLDRIKSALEIFYLERGAYPQKLEELAAARLIRKDDLFYRKGVSYQYEVKDGKYILKH